MGTCQWICWDLTVLAPPIHWCTFCLSREPDRRWQGPMTPSDDSIADGRALLERALADPFILLSDEEAQEPPTHVDDWFRFLMEQFPLWAFQADEYRKFHSSALGTTYPLG